VPGTFTEDFKAKVLSNHLLALAQTAFSEVPGTSEQNRGQPDVGLSPCDVFAEVSWLHQRSLGQLGNTQWI
jgi:hypothetical protein